MEPFANPDNETMRAMRERVRRIGGDEIAPVHLRENVMSLLGRDWSRS